MYKFFVAKTFLATISIFGIIVYLIFNYKMLYMNEAYSMWEYVKRTIHNNSADVRYIAIGDSRLQAGFAPNVKPNYKGVNLAVAAGSPIEGYYILKKYLEHNPTPESLLISYSPSHLDTIGAYWPFTVKFGFLDNKDYDEVEETDQRLTKKSTLGIDESYTDYLMPTKYGKDFFNGIFGLNWLKNYKVMKDLELSNGQKYFGTKPFSNALNDETKRDSFIPSLLVDFYFEKLLKLAQENKIKVCYYTMPFNETSFKATKQSYKEYYNKYIQKKSHRFNVKVCNQLNYVDNSNFGDKSHLYKGTNSVSKIMLNCLSR